MNVLFAYQQIDAGDCEHNDKQDDCRCGCVGRVAAGVAVEHVVDIAHNGVHARCIQVRPKECHRVGVGFKSADKAGDNQVKDHRGDHRQCDAVKDAPAPGAIHARGIVIILVHRGECAG